MRTDERGVMENLVMDVSPLRFPAFSLSLSLTAFMCPLLTISYHWALVSSALFKITETKSLHLSGGK